MVSNPPDKDGIKNIHIRVIGLGFDPYTLFLHFFCGFQKPFLKLQLR